MSLSEEHEMIIDLVRKFVTSELLPLEPAVLAREADGKPWHLTPEENEHLMARTKELGLWGLDAPESTGGYNLPNTVMARINEELGTTAVPFTFPPDSPNLLMLEKHGTPEQKEKYLVPYIEGKTISAICISEPNAGGDHPGNGWSFLRLSAQNSIIICWARPMTSVQCCQSSRVGIAVPLLVSSAMALM